MTRNVISQPAGRARPEDAIIMAARGSAGDHCGARGGRIIMVVAASVTYGGAQVGGRSHAVTSR